MTMSPPQPPSPPEGPPLGTNFSRRKAMQPLPPSPAFTRIFASSINIGDQRVSKLQCRLTSLSDGSDSDGLLANGAGGLLVRLDSDLPRIRTRSKQIKE